MRSKRSKGNLTKIGRKASTIVEKHAREDDDLVGGLTPGSRTRGELLG